MLTYEGMRLIALGPAAWWWTEGATRTVEITGVDLRSVLDRGAVEITGFDLRSVWQHGDGPREPLKLWRDLVWTYGGMCLIALGRQHGGGAKELLWRSLVLTYEYGVFVITLGVAAW